MRVKTIESLADLCNTVTGIANKEICVAAEKATDSAFSFGWPDVATLINEDDFDRFFPLLVAELEEREEVQYVRSEGFRITIYLGLPWIKHCKSHDAEESEMAPEDGKLEVHPMMSLPQMVSFLSMRAPDGGHGEDSLLCPCCGKRTWLGKYDYAYICSFCGRVVDFNDPAIIEDPMEPAPFFAEEQE